MNHPYNDSKIRLADQQRTVVTDGISTPSLEKVLQDMPAKTKVINSLGQAIGQIKSAYEVGVTANPMAADLSVFQELLAINKKLSETMLAINKLRGL